MPEELHEKREFLFDIQNPMIGIGSAETRILELASKTIAGAFVFYFSLMRIYNELAQYRKIIKPDSFGSGGIEI